MILTFFIIIVRALFLPLLSTGSMIVIISEDKNRYVVVSLKVGTSLGDYRYQQRRGLRCRLELRENILSPTEGFVNVGIISFCSSAKFVLSQCGVLRELILLFAVVENMRDAGDNTEAARSDEKTSVIIRRHFFIRGRRFLQ
jgi:hypothetical protein